MYKEKGNFKHFSLFYLWHFISRCDEFKQVTTQLLTVKFYLPFIFRLIAMSFPMAAMSFCLQRDVW